MGACAQELYNLGDRDNFFYLQHAMGLASSLGLGLALHLPEERVVVLDGDGSVLMNLGSLATLARYRPKNLLHIIFDNGSLLSTGGFSSHTTSGLTDLAAIARGAGVEYVATVTTPYGFGEAVLEALERRDLCVIVAKVRAVGPDHYGMDLALPENAFRFKRWIARRARGGLLAAAQDRLVQAAGSGGLLERQGGRAALARLHARVRQVACARAGRARHRRGDGRHRRGPSRRVRPALSRAHVSARRGQVRPGEPCNLDRLPPKGAILIAAPLKIVGGSGSPLRVLAITPA
jgi:sulfopyruvate decarboxylase subunit beta